MINKSFFFLSILFVSSLSLSFNAQAQDKSSLYHGAIAVNDQSTAARNQAIQTMFGQTLIKVSGQGKITEHPTILKEIKAALSYATEFGFESGDSGSVLNVSFNEELIDRLLKDNGFTLWDAERPTVMLWLVYEDEHGIRQIVNEQSNSEVLAEIKAVAKTRGLPLLVPIWDLDDQLVVSAGDVWGQFEDKVASANARYQSDYMILAKVTNHGISNNVSWSVFKMGNEVDIFGQTSTQISMTGTDETPSIAQAFAQVINQSTDFFAQQYSVDTTAGDGSILLTLTNVDSLTRYADIIDYLNSIKAVEQIVLVKVKGQEYQFKIDLLGNESAFLDLINLGSKMASITNYDPDLVLFEWRG
ncbi:DUF2066 domain-containing protein [Psychrobium sp. nBUS_13]|uniref:DUF2066 domain-containing protein n=1 Tax=Psychrobium sp. nBUS_13 TaxID=3395319 RepID=UPI003EB896CE